MSVVVLRQNPMMNNNPSQAKTLSQCIEQHMRDYFKQLDGELPNDLYQTALNQFERPLLAVVMEYCRGNQCKAAQALGISRGTLRKKLQQHHMA